jgi:hypothetical protein
MKCITFLVALYASCSSYAQLTTYNNYFDYKNINKVTFAPGSGWNDEQRYILTILKRSFQMKTIITTPRDTVFFWNGLMGQKTIYSKDSLVLFVLRPADTITRPCILLTHGNTAKYRSSWNENMNFYCVDLAMRGYCVAYYENPASFEAREIYANSNGVFNHVLENPRNAFYNGFQSAAAADIFMRHNASFFHVDVNKIFAGGYSFGAFCSLMLASADTAINFKDTMFDVQGGYNAKSIYTDQHAKNIKQAFSIGGGLPKQDTMELNSSHMGNFLDSRDSALSVLFLHGRTDNLVSFDLTKFADSATASNFFWGEGPRAIINNIAEQHLSIKTRLFVNCRSGHPFITSVCGYSNPYCLAQWQWQYLPEPPDNMASTDSYFTDSTHDTLLRYFAYSMTQMNDIGYLIGDFLQLSITHTPSVFADSMLFIQPRDSFLYSNANGHFILRNTDCEGHAVVTTIRQPLSPTEWNIYPNPTNTTLHIESGAVIKRIIVYNLLGAILKDIPLNDRELLLDVHDLPAGQYIAALQSENQYAAKKISIVH